MNSFKLNKTWAGIVLLANKYYYKNDGYIYLQKVKKKILKKVFLEKKEV